MKERTLKDVMREALNRDDSKDTTVSESPSVTGLGLPLEEEKDPDKLRLMASMLWQLLDDIDTASDIAKSNDIFYRKMVEAVQKRRHQIITSDGYGLFLPEEKQP